MRIIAGKFRGRILAKSDHLKSLRPTSDRNRESLFNILFSAKFLKEINFQPQNANMLDLCCGTGAVGFEAISRGIKSVTFIDKNNSHLEIVKKNSEILGIENQIKILNFDSENLPKNQEFFEIIFLDPPYKNNIEVIIDCLIKKNWIEKNSLLIIESKENFDLTKNQNLKLLSERKYGKTIFSFVILVN
jgi:16S rRNA (guanine966-N2)-methyltransferase